MPKGQPCACVRLNKEQERQKHKHRQKRKTTPIAQPGRQKRGLRDRCFFVVLKYKDPSHKKNFKGGETKYFFFKQKIEGDIALIRLSAWALLSLRNAKSWAFRWYQPDKNSSPFFRRASAKGVVTSRGWDVIPATGVKVYGFDSVGCTSVSLSLESNQATRDAGWEVLGLRVTRCN